MWPVVGRKKGGREKFKCGRVVKLEVTGFLCKNGWKILDSISQGRPVISEGKGEGKAKQNFALD
ncbi:hypothetical protein TIFTF001_033351 [Ficus carica]|uniref:Uncharacterized protein n=1 Tax=Ficus carica TaxID=3494 RepID=A0AA88E552_FICCA|nr:hypothetical protein TIFTF001_041848 [Ficus carica]GMN64274.1 hypothetical protein TIFTF001_033351 [Ficus carica]